jgi:hypothetical protein
MFDDMDVLLGGLDVSQRSTFVLQKLHPRFRK